MTHWSSEPIHVAVPGDPPPDALAEVERDANGSPIERRTLGGQEVILHFEDVPPEDRTVLYGIPVTTALRTVIDLATEVEAAELDRMLGDCLARSLFTEDEALTRLARTDMLRHPGAKLLLRALSRHLS